MLLTWRVVKTLNSNFWKACSLLRKDTELIPQTAWWCFLRQVLISLPFPAFCSFSSSSSCSSCTLFFCLSLQRKVCGSGSEKRNHVSAADHPDSDEEEGDGLSSSERQRWADLLTFAAQADNCLIPAWDQQHVLCFAFEKYFASNLTFKYVV